LTSARGMVTANAPNACEGCSLTDPVAPRPSQDVEIVEAYQAALVNHERAARELPGAADLAAMLEASGRVLASVTAQGGGLSISR
jgi:hypothetical protein